MIGLFIYLQKKKEEKRFIISFRLSIKLVKREEIKNHKFFLIKNFEILKNNIYINKMF